MVELKCNCGSRARVPSTIAGRSVRCLSCEAVLHVPQSEQVRTRIKLPSIKRDLATEAHARALSVNVAAINTLASLALAWMLYRHGGLLMGQATQLVMSLALVVGAVAFWHFEDLPRKFLCGILATNMAFIGVSIWTGQTSLAVGLGSLGLAGGYLWLVAADTTRRICTPAYQLMVARSPQEPPRWWTSAVFWAPLMLPVSGLAALVWTRIAL